MTDTITRELLLRADPEVVWRAVTDPDLLREWLADEVTLELTPGGAAGFVVDGEVRSGWVEEVQPPRDGAGRLTFWWQVGDEPASRVAFELTPTSDGTLLRVREARPLEILDLVGIPLAGGGGSSFGPALVAA